MAANITTTTVDPPAGPANVIAGCTCPSASSCCAASTFPTFIVETPRMLWADPMANIPYWVWIVIAIGVLLVILIIVLIIVLLCRGDRNCFWCCCLSDDVASTKPIVQDEVVTESNVTDRRGKRSQILYRYPDDDLSDIGYASRSAVNNNYTPRAQRINTGRPQYVRTIDDIDEEPRPIFGGGRRSIMGGTGIARGNNGGPLTTVTVGGSASAMGRPSSVISGYHSAAVQVAPSSNGVRYGSAYGGGPVPSIYPPL